MPLTQEAHEHETHRADPRARRKAVIIVIIAAIAGAATLHAVGSSANWLRAWAEGDPEHAARVVFALLAVSVSVPMLGLAFWAARFAAKINRGGRYPPHDARLTRDTRVRVGAAAERFTYLYFLFAAVAVAIAIHAPVLFWRLYHGLLERVP
jgi:cytochrome bd-type quinol oxidase subunit 2